MKLNLELLGKEAAQQVEKVLYQVEEYLNEDCVLKKSELLVFIKRNTTLTFYDLEFILFESWRTLIRVQNIHNLIPELKEMYKFREITKPIAYALATLDQEEQINYYNILQECLVMKMNVDYQDIKDIEEPKSRLVKIGYPEFVEIRNRMNHQVSLN
ncbi:hypothetical protein ACMGD3_24250 [Lysinibacillus sphaericus]|uniref:hypothetical protein n=1 Tax=Lysinibacillus sphaericus TaxID=1421 RepID=UPI003F79A371